MNMIEKMRQLTKQFPDMAFTVKAGKVNWRQGNSETGVLSSDDLTDAHLELLINEFANIVKESEEMAAEVGKYFEETGAEAVALVL